MAVTHGLCFNCQRRVELASLKVVVGFIGTQHGKHVEVCTECNDRVNRNRAEEAAQAARIRAAEAGYVPPRPFVAFSCGFCSYTGQMTEPEGHIHCPNCGGV